MSLGQFFRESGSACGAQELQAEDDALSAALNQLELSTSRPERALDAAIAAVRASTPGPVMRSMHRILSPLTTVTRLETFLELALSRPPAH